MRSKLTALAAAGALSLCSISPVFAGSVTQPGETLGAAVGAPIPPGVYFTNTLSYGCRDISPEDVCATVTIPVIIWSTPWNIVGGRLQLWAWTPALDVGQDAEFPNTPGVYRSGFYNPGGLIQLAWDLGGGLGVSYGIGAYFDNDPDVAWSDTSLNQRFAISYTGGGWNLTAHLIYGTHFDSVNPDPQFSPCPAPALGFNCNPDFINLDLTATKKFGKWELGPVAFASWDVSDPIDAYRQQQQWAVGGLVGYDFGPVNLQLYATTDVTQDNYNGYETRLWTRVTFPIWNPTLHTPTPVTGRRY
jgi:Putative MetA-pathway of phenol degradation